MKRIYLILLVALVSLTALAEKTYIHIHVYDMDKINPAIQLSGDIPEGIKASYPQSTLNTGITIGELLNKLSAEGFSLEYMCTSNGGNSTVHGYYVCSRVSNQQPPVNTSVQVTMDDSSDVTEMARFNLQGLPVTEKDKGFQIIVYSNYTTKSILVE